RQIDRREIGQGGRAEPVNLGYLVSCGASAPQLRRIATLGLALLAVTLAEAASDPAFFAGKVYPVFEAAQCRSCHAADGVASGTRLRFPEPSASADQVQAFGLSLAPLVDRADPSKSLLLNKPTAQVRHTGGERIKPGSDQAAVLL